MRKMRGVLFITFVLSGFITSSLRAEAGTASANLLSLRDGARSSAMGGAFVGVSDDINAVYHNPAGMGHFNSYEFQASQMSGLSNFNLTDISLAIPLGDLTAANVRSLGTLSFSFATLDYGEIDATNSVGSSIGQLDSNDKVFSFGWGKAFNRRFSIGAGADFYSLEVFGENADGTAFAVGTMYKLFPRYLQIGLNARNIGSDVKYDSQSDPLPQEIIGGLGFTPFRDRLMIACDFGSIRDEGSLVRTGIELKLNSVVKLRAGYDSLFDAGNGFSLGAGLELIDLEVGFFPVNKIGIDYAVTPTDELGTYHRISLVGRIGT